MKVKENFVLRQVADSWVVLPLGGAAIDFDGMLTLNEAGMLLWKALEQGCERKELAAVLMKEYIVKPEQALEDVEAFVSRLVQVGCVEE